MTVSDILGQIRSRGATIQVRDGNLILKPPGAVEDLVHLIKANKLSLVEHLGGEDRALTDYLVANIKSGAAYSRILPGVRNYLQRTLPAEMVREIEEAFAEHVNRLER
jgi:hypothetical protein